MGKKFIQVNSNNEVHYINYVPFSPIYGLNKTEAELSEIGFLIDEIPQEPVVEGQTAVLKYNRETGELFYEFVERQLSDAEKISKLEAEKAALEVKVTEQDARMKQMESDALEFQDFVLSELGVV